MTRRQAWIVAYDVSDTRRRDRLSKLLGGYGERLQKSLFLCLLDERRQHRLTSSLEREPLEAGDRLHMFELSNILGFSGPDGASLVAPLTCRVVE